MTDALLVGNNLAVVVAAVELADAGAEVVLVTDGRPPGGHFRGLSIEGADFDLGMVLLEKTGSVAPAPDLETYQARVRNDWTRFGALVDSWLDSSVALRRVPTPECLLDGTRWPDFLIANRLDVLSVGNFTAPPPLPRDDPRHAAQKVGSTAYDTVTYADAAALNHGADIQERLVEPFARKLLGPGGTRDALARYHRAGWLPLYWPETLAAACAGQATGLAEYPFWTTETGFVGELVRTLEQRLATASGVTVVGTAVDSVKFVDGRVEVRTQDDVWTSDRPVLGLTHDRLQTLLDLPATARPAGASVVLTCCLVRGSAMRNPVGCLTVLDESLLTYRVTDQDRLAGLDPEWHRVVVEAGAGQPAASVDELVALLDIPSRDDVRVVRTLTARNAVSMPSAASLAVDQSARSALSEALPAGLLTGTLLGQASASMNDQIVQGLATAKELM